MRLIILLLSALLFSSSFANIPIGNFSCVGTHPDWKLTINQQAFTYLTKHDRCLIKPTIPLAAEQLPLSFLRVYETRTRNTDEPVIIVIKDMPEGCTDGTHQERHEYESVVIFKNKILTGCCDDNNN